MTDPAQALAHLLRRAGDFSGTTLDTRRATFALCSGGYSHDNFHVTCDLGEFALRLRRSPPPKPWFELAFLRDWAQPLAPRLIAWDEGTGNLLTQWCDWPSRHHNRPTLGQCRNLLALLADSPTSAADLPTYPLRAQVRQWLTHADDKAGLAQLADTPDLPGPLARCHNDLNGDNLLHSDGQWQVLDWEWAGLNNPLFDAATLAAGLPQGCASLEQLTPDASAKDRALAWRWFCLREYAFAVNALTNPELDAATATALAAQRDRYAADPELSLT